MMSNKDQEKIEILEAKIDMILTKGRAIKKPANAGFFSDNQLAMDIIKLEIKT